MEKEQLEEKKLEKPEATELPPEAPPREDVRVLSSAIRCPYCHSDVSPETADWVACKSCLARHHVACWGENGTCSTCGHAKFLPATPSSRRAKSSRSAWVVTLGVVMVAFLAFAALGISLKHREVMGVPPAPGLVAPAARSQTLKDAFPTREKRTLKARNLVTHDSVDETRELYLDEYADWLRQAVLDGYQLQQPTNAGATAYLKSVALVYRQESRHREAELMEAAIRILEK
ncbi:hypothetical protein HY251_13750 [bacterium]|nr:hypothetical protein [bacterium]